MKLVGKKEFKNYEKQIKKKKKQRSKSRKKECFKRMCGQWDRVEKQLHHQVHLIFLLYSPASLAYYSSLDVGRRHKIAG